MATTTSPRTAAWTVTVTVAVLLAVAALVAAGVTRADRGAAGDGAAGNGAERSGLAESTGSSSDERDASAVAVSIPEAVHAVAVLRDWDAARAAAWQAGDVAALRELYVAGSPAGRRDVRMLRRWVRRGVHVEDMSMQVFSLRLRARTDRRLALEVTDRLVGAVAVDTATGERWRLPRDRATTRRLVFRRPAETWLLDVVYDRPAARTARTSGSEKS